VVLGSVAAQNLQMYHLNGRAPVSIGSTWFTVIGIMRHAALMRPLSMSPLTFTV
jgi:hypothetical protein